MFSLRSWDSSVSRSSGFEAAPRMMEPIHTIKSVNQGQRYNLHRQTQGYPVPWHFHSQTQDLQQSVRYLGSSLSGIEIEIYIIMQCKHVVMVRNWPFSRWSLSTRRYHLLRVLHGALHFASSKCFAFRKSSIEWGICDFSEAVEKWLRKFHWF